MSCRPPPVTLCLHLADLNSTHCSHTASWYPRPRLRSSLLTPSSTTSVSISTTPGASTWNLPLWIFVGLTVQEIPLRFEIIKSSLICYVNTVLIGLKAKNLESLIGSKTSTAPSQPYIMRMSCHKALPNPNMLPWLIVVKNNRLAVRLFLFQFLFLLISCLFSFMSFCLCLSQFGLSLDHD